MDLFLDFNYFSFSKANSDAKHLTKHQIQVVIVRFLCDMWNNIVATPFQDHRKNSSLISLACYKFVIACLWHQPQPEEHRRCLFLHNLETKCVNQAMIYVIYALKLKTLDMKQSSSSLFYCAIDPFQQQYH